jgi:hypothetical protein
LIFEGGIVDLLRNHRSSSQNGPKLEYIIRLINVTLTSSAKSTISMVNFPAYTNSAKQ